MRAWLFGILMSPHTSLPSQTIVMGATDNWHLNSYVSIKWRMKFRWRRSYKSLHKQTENDDMRWNDDNDDGTRTRRIKLLKSKVTWIVIRSWWTKKAMAKSAIPQVLANINSGWECIWPKTTTPVTGRVLVAAGQPYTNNAISRMKWNEVTQKDVCYTEGWILDWISALMELKGIFGIDSKSIFIQVSLVLEVW